MTALRACELSALQPAAWCSRGLGHHRRSAALAAASDGSRESGAQRRGPVVLGLTGSVGMGKSTVANMFRELGVPVLDADEVVHQLYARGGAAVQVVASLFPSAVVDGAVDRTRLGVCVLGDRPSLARLEQAVHPLVAQCRQQFVSQVAASGAPLVVLDIPLLYEKGLQHEVDFVAVVSAPPQLQRERVLARGWSEEKFLSILALQVADERKREVADFIIDTAVPLADTQQAVARLASQLAGTQPAGLVTQPDCQ